MAAPVLPNAGLSTQPVATSADTRASREQFVTDVVGVIGGTLAGCAVCLLVVSLILRWRRGLATKNVGTRKDDETFSSRQNSFPFCSKNKSFNSDMLARSLSLTPKKHVHFSLRDLSQATHKFDEANVLGEGGFGKVYKGVLPIVPFSKVAIKVLRGESSQGLKEFVTEIELLSRLDHKHLVRLLGHCVVGDKLLLVYRHVANGSLADHLHDKRQPRTRLEWELRVKIALGAALGIQYLHSQKPPVLHRDIKAANILLTRGFNAKVCDFGFAKQQSSAQDDPECTPSRSGAIGTLGYVAPESFMTGEVSSASDVYSFGVVLLELLSGRKPLDFTKPDKDQSLVAWAKSLLNQERVTDVLDPCLLEDLAPVRDSVLQVLRTARKCLDQDCRARPSIGEVVDTLQQLHKKTCVAVDVTSDSDSASDIAEDSFNKYDDCNIPEMEHFAPGFIETKPVDEQLKVLRSSSCNVGYSRPISWLIAGFSKPSTPSRG